MGDGFAGSHWPAAFVQRLRELGWIEGRTVAYRVSLGGGTPRRAAEIAAEFVRLKVDVIVTSGDTPRRSKAGNIDHPDCLRDGAGPGRSGLVASLARPGGNVTGLSLQSTDLAAKRLELLREVVPGLRRLGIMANIGNPAAVLEMRRGSGSARKLGIDVTSSKSGELRISRPPSRHSRAVARRLYVCTDPLVHAQRDFASTLSRSPHDCRRCYG